MLAETKTMKIPVLPSASATSEPEPSLHSDADCDATSNSSASRLAPTRRRPRIGVTGPAHGGLAAWFFTAAQLSAVGAKPIRVTPSRPHWDTPLDGLVISGGSDVDPLLFGEERKEAPSRQEARRWLRMDAAARLLSWPLRMARRMLGSGALPIDPDRDKLELHHLKRALDCGLPVLGICRGAQLMNVFLGGNLHRDLRSAGLAPTRFDTFFPKRHVCFEDGSLLRPFLGACTDVNSLHNQAVDTLGAGLRAAARDTDGVVQVIEHTEHPFMVGVQWHPEYLPQETEQREIFRCLALHAIAARDGVEIESVSEPDA